MKTFIKAIKSSLLVSLLSILLLSCEKGPVYVVELNKSAEMIVVGHSLDMTATITPAVEGGVVTYSTDNGDVVELAIDGNSVTVTAKAEGSAVITASYHGANATCSVIVKTQSQVESRWPSEINTSEMGRFIKIQRDMSGEYMMGSESGEADEKPVHNVVFSASYYMCEYEVTQAQWEAVTGSNPSVDKGPNMPVNNVSYSDIAAFLKKLNKNSGREFRLPTEAEWEYAARGGEKSQGYIYSGSNDIDAVAWYDDNEGVVPHEVGKKAANELGLYDMSGNVLEWCSDKKATYPSESVTDPVGAGSRYVVRGGSFDKLAKECTCTYRGVGLSESNKFYNLGLRLVLSEPLESELLP